MILDIEMPSYKLEIEEQIKLGEILLKSQAIEENLSLLIDDDLSSADIERIIFDFDWAIDEFGLLTYDGDYANHIEVVTKEIAESNDWDYKKLGKSNYYYREL